MVDEPGGTGPADEPMMSAFTPIADYAFLSDCHTGALVAPDGSVDWLCVPAFDSPSVFGALLDREAGSFRFGPYGIFHPVSRAYVPGTNVVERTWRTRTGWVVVRDALTMGPREGADQLPDTMRAILTKSLTVRGFINYHFASEYYDAFQREVSAGIANGRIRYREDFVEGLENTPKAFIGMLEGRNFGKLIVRVNGGSRQ